MDIRVLGPLEVEHEGRVLVLRGRKRRSALAMLVLHAGQAVSVDRLAEAVWGDAQPADVGTAVRSLIHHVRDVLTAGSTDARPIVRTTPAGYVLDFDAAQIDSRRFERLVEHGRQRSGETAMRTLSEALELWRGEAFQDFAYAEFVQAEARRLNDLRLACTEDLFEIQLATGNHETALANLEAFCVDHPTRERALRCRILALYRSGRQTEALEAYEHGRRSLADELGADPSPELRLLHAQVLRHDPSLTVTAPPRVPVTVDDLPVMLTTFVGRDGLVREVHETLADARVMTLTGPVASGRPGWRWRPPVAWYRGTETGSRSATSLPSTTARTWSTPSPSPSVSKGRRRCRSTSVCSARSASDRPC